MFSETLLQSLIWPDTALCSTEEVYFHLAGGAKLSSEGSTLLLASGATVRSNSYFNLFNIGKWARNAPLESLALKLAGQGVFNLSIVFETANFERQTVFDQEIVLQPDTALSTPLTHEILTQDTGVLYWTLTSLQDGSTLEGADWVTQDAPRQTPDLAVVVTTFKREAAVQHTAQRFAKFAETSPFGAALRMIVIDNGDSANIPATSPLSCITNRNLGGSGGFARGLLEAKQAGASHCLFMDDDAAIHMHAIDRTYAFLAFATDPKTAVAGALANSEDRFRLWENGAQFHGICRPCHMSLDLRKHTQVMELELETTAPGPANFYGGWWFFAFSITQVEHMPFPFFVRGDDVSFSLAHQFNTVTLPGVIAYQDEDFSTKETPLSVYLDVRSHLAHHLALPQMAIGRLGLAKIILRFWLRSMINCHYETVDAALMGIEDSLAGPDYFATNPDVATRRKEISDLTSQERWQPIQDVAAARRPDTLAFDKDRLLHRLLMKATLNGHLLPFFKTFGNSVSLDAELRGNRREIWGAAQISYVTSDGRLAYSVSHDKRRAFKQSLRCLRLAYKAVQGYHAITRDWRAGYQHLTTEGYWQDALGLTQNAPSEGRG